MHDAVPPDWAEFVAGWELGIYRDPILCGVIAGLVLGYLGVFVVLRRMVFVTAAISQSAGLGVALAFYAQIHLGLDVHPVVGATALALFATALFTLSPERYGLSRESVLGLAYIVAWALAILVGDRITQEAHDIASILFGSAVLVRELDLLLVGIVGFVALALHFAWHRGFVYAAFDREGARVQGLPVQMLDYVAWLLVALMVSVSTRALGVLPVFAFAVLPAMSGLLLSQRIRYVLLIAAVLGALAGGLGYLFAFFLEFPVGASQATLAVLFFVVALPARLVRRA